MRTQLSKMNQHQPELVSCMYEYKFLHICFLPNTCIFQRTPTLTQNIIHQKSKLYGHKIHNNMFIKYKMKVQIAVDSKSDTGNQNQILELLRSLPHYYKKIHWQGRQNLLSTDPSTIDKRLQSPLLQHREDINEHHHTKSYVNTDVKYEKNQVSSSPILLSYSVEHVKHKHSTFQNNVHV